MITNRPSIFIYTYNPDTDILKEICAGIEEEGVLFDVVENRRWIPEIWPMRRQMNLFLVRESAFLMEKQTPMQMRNVNRDKPVFLLDRPDKEMSRTGNE